MEGIVVYCTVGSVVEASHISKVLVQERLCGCVNRLPKVISTYMYEGDFCEEEEILLIIKTLRSRFEALKNRITELHSYDVPEIIAAPIIEGNEPYLQWLQENVR